MSQPPDPDDITAPKDPADYRERPLMGLGFWALMAFGVLCVLAGAAVALLVPRLLSARPLAESALEVRSTEAASLTPAPAAVTIAAPPPVAAPADVSRLDARVAALEGQERGATRAAAAALAAAAVLDAARASGPFADELADLREISPDLPELASLARLAETGAPSRASLAAAYSDYAARAASAARAPGEGASLGARMGYALTRIVSVRRVAEDASGPDALLVRAEGQVEDGDLAHAVRTLEGLPPAAREAMAPWRARAERRAEIDRLTAALRARALRDLAAASRAER